MSTIADKLIALNNHKEAAFNKVASRGGTFSGSRTTANLAEAIDTIPAGSSSSIQESKVNNTMFSTTTPDTGYDAIGSVTNFEVANPAYLDVPAGYTLLDYLKIPASATPTDLSTCAYCDIDTSVISSAAYRSIVFKREITTTSSSEPLITCYEGTLDRTRMFTAYSSSSRRVFYYAGKSSSGTSISFSSTYNNKIMSASMSLYSTLSNRYNGANGLSTVAKDTTSVSCTRLFANSSSGCGVETWFYGASLFQGSTDSNLFLPMKDSDGTVGVYDMKHDKFYSSLGVEFQAGTIAAEQKIPVYQLGMNKMYKVDSMEIITPESNYFYVTAFDTNNLGHVIPLCEGIFTIVQGSKMIIMSVQ